MNSTLCFAEYRYAEYGYAECHYAVCRYAECHYAECRYAECRYAECRYSECRGAIFIPSFLLTFLIFGLDEQMTTETLSGIAFRIT
jgi:hypothetical protein